MKTKYSGTQTEKNLLEAFAGESQARNKYTYFASKAKKERKNKQQRSLHFVQGRVLVLFFLLRRTHADKFPDFS